jgi:cyclic pyranopterin phosphate synthase
VTAVEIVERIDAEFPIEPVDRNYRGEVANRYRYRDGSGEIGIIASVSEPFCGDCTRARLTIEGKLVTCLFAADGTDLRTPLRAGASDDELRELIEGVWTRRTDRYSEERAELTASGDLSSRKAKIEMYQIGG